MTKEKNHHSIHREWLQHLQPEGLVVTPNTLEEMGFYLNRAISDERAIYAEITDLNEVDLDHAGQNIVRLKQKVHARLFNGLLKWGESGKNRLDLLVDKDKIKAEQTLNYKLPEYDEILRPSYALYDLDAYDKVMAEEAQSSVTNQADTSQSKEEDDDDPFAMFVSSPTQEAEAVIPINYGKVKPVLLVQHIEGDTPLDKNRPKAKKKLFWDETYHNRFERLLREVEVPVGILTNDLGLRLIYAPKGESSGYMTFNYTHLREASGRSLLSALLMLLKGNKLTDGKHSLPSAMKASRKHQATVSEKLSQQVLDAFWALLRGFEAAHMEKGEHAKHQAFQELAQNNTTEIYEGVLTTIMRLIFLVYVEEEGLIQDDESSSIYQQSYSVTGLFHRLEQDAVRYEGSMSERRGAWAQLLTLTRMIFKGGSYKGFKVPVRQGELFKPDRFPFLEGRSRPDKDAPKDSTPVNESISVPPISDECIYQVLSKLLRLDGERLSYRALGVEEIGSVYESMMGYDVECAEAQSVVLQPKDVVIRLDHLLAVKPGDRKKWLETTAETKFSGSKTEKERLKLLKDAQNEDELFETLKGKLSPRSSERLVKGSLYLQPGEERRRTGSHYTPRSLSSPVVAKALEPHLARIYKSPKEQWAKKILQLKICDPAMGSGAFLVETCRQLADALVKAWQVTGTTLDEAKNEESILEARRRIAQSCLYGVDKNLYAVSLAKLSLWLFTLSKEQSFTFLDHALRCGDSLVGVGNEELAKLEWVVEKPKEDDKTKPLKGKATKRNQKSGDATQEQTEFELDFTHDALSKAIATRIELIQDGSASYEAMSKAYDKAKLATVELKVIADALVSTFFAHDKKGRKPTKKDFQTKVRYWAQQKDLVEKKLLLAEFKQQAMSLTELEHPLSTFHWGLEFPEVFSQGGFHAFVGNPPFMGKNTLINSSPEYYVDWLKNIHEESHGNSDVVAHFFRRTFSYLRSLGTMGLVSTNTIGQGDTKYTGLRYLCVKSKAKIYNTVRRRVWPGNAAVVVSIVHMSRGEENLACEIDGRSVPSISAFLTVGDQHENPIVLSANANKSFQGSVVLGMGFTFADTDKSTAYDEEGTAVIGSPSLIADIDRLKEKAPKNMELIFPYIGGSELNSHPEHEPHRYVINFGSRSLEEAKEYPDLLDIVKRKVKPERDKLKDNSDGRRRKQYWWQYGRSTPALDQAIEGMDRVLGISQVTSFPLFAWLPTDVIFAHRLYIFTSDKNSFAAVMSSRIHTCWALFFGSSLEDRFMYSNTSCFKTFPFPENYSQLEEAGKAYYEYRAKLMADADFRIEQGMVNDLEPEGMTKTYNHFHNPQRSYPGIIKLRELHAKMDRAVADAYGWTDFQLQYAWVDHYSGLLLEDRLAEIEEDSEIEEQDYKKYYKARYTFTPAVKDEVMGRLLALNAERAEQEAEAEKKNGKKAKGKKKTRANKTKKQSTQTHQSAEPKADKKQKGDASGTQGTLI